MNWVRRDLKTGKFIKTIGKLPSNCKKCGGQFFEYPFYNRVFCKDCVNHWSDEEIKILIKNYEIVTTKKLKELLPNRTIEGIRHKGEKLGLDREWAKGWRRYNIDKEGLERLYLKEKKSINEIANEKNYNPKTITSRLKEYNIKIRNPSESAKSRKKDSYYRKRPTKDMLNRLYHDELLSQEDIAEKLNTSQRRVYTWMKELNIKARARVKHITNMRPNKPEKRLIEIIDKHHLQYKYTGNGSFWIETLNPDFVNCNGTKKVIEVFGDYWHGEGARSWKEEEFGRKAILSQYGFKCLVIWEHELKECDENEIVRKIEEFDRN